MTDDTGVIEHASFSVPARESGYCVDDNARALIVALHADRLHSTGETKRLVSTTLAFLHAAQTVDGKFRNRMSYGRQFAADSARRTARGGRCGRSARRSAWPGTTASGCSPARCSNAASPSPVSSARVAARRRYSAWPPSWPRIRR